MAYDVDFSDVTAFRNGMARLGAGQVMTLARPRFQRMGEAVRSNARRNIKSKSGTLAGSGTVKTSGGGGGVETVIEFKAFNKGFNYAVAVEYGRRGFGPKNAKVLRFEVGGKVVFAKRVGPARAQKFLERGLQQSMPTIVNEAQGLENDIARMIEAA